jgi:hypothetical protein
MKYAGRSMEGHSHYTLRVDVADSGEDVKL